MYTHVIEMKEFVEYIIISSDSNTIAQQARVWLKRL